ncbi:MAG: HAD hydrolase family protein [Armatimonadetes bacterium]|nr:HAD hydrolase family protein [Armatimonadota bacterium]
MAKIKLNRLELIVYDFDGVMTNNKVIVDQFGNESVNVNRSDGLAIAEIKKMGIKQAILSTEKNPVVLKRAEKLNIPCIYGSDNKLLDLKYFLKENNVSPKNTMYIGNDINDMEAMKFVGYSGCPVDAHESIKAIACTTLKTKGGNGVVRELFDLIIKK